MLDTVYLFNDRALTPDESVAGIDALIFTSGGSRIFGQILKPTSLYAGKRPCVIFFHGFAGFCRFDDAAQALCRAGCVVVIPHHRGAWGSEGYYSFTSCIEDAVCLANFVHSAEFCEKYKIDPDAIFLMGHSMGGNTVVNACDALSFIRGVILLTPCDISMIFSRGTKADAYAFLEENGGGILRTKGLDALYKNVKDNIDTMYFPVHAEKLRDMNIFIVSADRDDVCPPELTAEPLWSALKAYSSVAVRRRSMYDSDHSLLSVRVALIREVADFINACLGK